jgi:hypothetical protein
VKILEIVLVIFSLTIHFVLSFFVFVLILDFESCFFLFLFLFLFVCAQNVLDIHQTFAVVMDNVIMELVFAMPVSRALIVLKVSFV